MSALPRTRASNTTCVPSGDKRGEPTVLAGTPGEIGDLTRRHAVGGADEDLVAARTVGDENQLIPVSREVGTAIEPGGCADPGTRRPGSRTCRARSAPPTCSCLQAMPRMRADRHAAAPRAWSIPDRYPAMLQEYLRWRARATIGPRPVGRTKRSRIGRPGSRRDLPGAGRRT